MQDSPATFLPMVNPELDPLFSRTGDEIGQGSRMSETQYLALGLDVFSIEF